MKDFKGEVNPKAGLEDGLDFFKHGSTSEINERIYK